jgi:MFS family permease
VRDASTTTTATRGHIATLAALGFATLSAMTTQTIVIPLLPRLREELQTSDAAVTWVVTVTVATGVLATPLLGRLGDLYGRKRALIASLTACTLGMALAGAADSLPLLIAGRVLQGVALAVFPLSLALVREVVPQRRLRGAVGTLSVCVSLSAGVALVGAALLASATSGYRAVFWVGAVVLLASLILVVIVVREPPQQRGDASLDVKGAILLTAWLACALIGITEGNTWGWTSLRTLGILAVAFAGIAVWWRTERSAAHPLVDTQVFLLPPVVAANAVGFLSSYGVLIVWVTISEFAQTPARAGYGFSLDIMGTALIMLPWPITSGISRPLCPLLLRVLPATWVLAIGCCGATGGLLSVLLFHAAPWQIVIGCLFTGMGSGLIAFTMPLMIIETVPRNQTGVATGMNQILRLIGQTMGGATVTALLTVTASGWPAEHAYTTLFLIATVACGALALVALPWSFMVQARLAASQRAAAGVVVGR